MPERTDTRSFQLTPVGNYKFVCSKVPVKKLTNGDRQFAFYEFEFEFQAPDGSIKTHSERFMTWLVGPLLKAFGFKEKETEPGVFEWEKADCVGKKVDAKIIHEPDKKDKTKMRSRMVDIIEGLPF
jgi:hypothetical protein